MLKASTKTQVLLKKNKKQTTKKNRWARQSQIDGSERSKATSFTYGISQNDEPMGCAISDRWIRERSKASASENL